MDILGLGLVVGVVAMLGHFLTVLLPYAVLASTLSKDEDEDSKPRKNRFKDD